MPASVSGLTGPEPSFQTIVIVITLLYIPYNTFIILFLDSKVSSISDYQSKSSSISDSGAQRPGRPAASAVPGLAQRPTGEEAAPEVSSLFDTKL